MEKRRKKHIESSANKLKKYFTFGLAAIALSFALSSCNTSAATPEADPRPSQVLSIETIVSNTQGLPPEFYGSVVDLEWNTAGRGSSISAPSVSGNPCKPTAIPDIPEGSAPFDVRDNICRNYLDIAKTLHVPEEKRIDFVLFLASRTIAVDREYVKTICENQKAGACVTTNIDPAYILTDATQANVYLAHETTHYLSNFLPTGYVPIAEDSACVKHLRNGTFQFIIKSEENEYDVTFTTGGEYFATVMESGANNENSRPPYYLKNATQDFKRQFWELGEKQRDNENLSLLPLLVPNNLLTEQPDPTSLEDLFDRIIKLFGGLDKFLELSSKFNQLNNIHDEEVFSETSMQEACGITK